MPRPKKTADRPNISVKTVPNGYTLTVDGQEYMYFNALDLVEGMFIHIGLKIGDFVSRENINDLVAACATWPKEGDAIKEAARLTKQVEELTEAHQRDTARISELAADKKTYFDKALKLQGEVTGLRKRLEAIAKAIRDVDTPATAPAKPAKAETPDKPTTTPPADETAAKSPENEPKKRGRKPNNPNPTKKEVGEPYKKPGRKPKTLGHESTEPKPIKTSRKGGRAKADAAILAEMERQARESGAIK